MMAGDMKTSLQTIDRATIFSTILSRQALRREAHLPLLDVRAMYQRAVEQALWQRHVELHLDQVCQHVLARQRVKHGAAWPTSRSGWMVLSALAQQELEEKFRNRSIT